MTTFGLGDSSYPKSVVIIRGLRMAGTDSLTRFNWAARKIHKRLVQLGANEAYPRGEADEQHDEGSTLQLSEWQRVLADSQ